MTIESVSDHEYIMVQVWKWKGYNSLLKIKKYVPYYDLHQLGMKKIIGLGRAF